MLRDIPWRNGRVSRSCERLVEWAEEITQTQSALVTFLVGTLPPEPGKDQTRSIQCLSGHPGVRKHISDFVGLEVTKQKHLRILRNVAEVMPSFIPEVMPSILPKSDEDEDESSADEDDEDDGADSEDEEEE